jgi:hypothetical protein
MAAPWLKFLILGLQVLVFGYFLTLNGLYLAVLLFSVVWCR